MLLNVIKRPRNYDKIKTINCIVNHTFQSACNVLSLLGNDKECNKALEEASYWAIALELR